MAEQRRLIIHFTDGTKKLLEFPQQVADADATLAARLKEALEARHLVIEADGGVMSPSTGVPDSGLGVFPGGGGTNRRRKYGCKVASLFCMLAKRRKRPAALVTSALSRRPKFDAGAASHSSTMRVTVQTFLPDVLSTARWS